MPWSNRILTDAQLRTEMAKCEGCEEKPCKAACPADCSPLDFIRAARVGEPSDIRRAAAEILLANPFGGVCGITCPTWHCRDACVHARFDMAVEIPSVQATLVAKARRLGLEPWLPGPEPSGRRVAVVGAGPAGLAAAAVLAREGHAVVVIDQLEVPGGACNLIPAHRLPRGILLSDVLWLLRLGDIRLELGRHVDEPEGLLAEGFDAVVMALGLGAAYRLEVPGEEAARSGLDFLADPSAFRLPPNVVVVGGGATAVDCAVTARLRGAAQVEIIALERWDEMPLTLSERSEIEANGVAVTGRSRILAIRTEGSAVRGVEIEKVTLPSGVPFHPRAVVPIPGSLSFRGDVCGVIVAIGAGRTRPLPVDHPAVFAAGDFLNGPSTVVSAVASGKNAARAAHALLSGLGQAPRETEKVGRFEKSRVRLSGYRLPISLETTFFGRPIRSPFLLSAAPPTDGLRAMQKAYEAGWAGGVMKTAFDGVPIHIPAAYMHLLGRQTYGNCDNVSEHALDRVCREIEELNRAWPDRLTVASTGGPVTGDLDGDRNGWQSNTRKLEAAGAMAIEYSLSCPQGGDGTEGDIVSQNARLTARIVDWVLEAGQAEVPKLFKLTGAVTSIAAILLAVREAFERHPGKKAGVTLANTFPSLAFRAGEKSTWEEGVVVGMSGEGIVPISNLTLASVAGMGVRVSGNGGAMDYRAAAHFLALGAETVQFCTIVLQHGYGVVDDLHSGLSHLLADRGIPDVATLVGRALPEPVRGFMDLPSASQISQVDETLCMECGNCTRCPYLAISLRETGGRKLPFTDAARCIGCGLCTLKCFSEALRLRDRTEPERVAVRET
jgi:dihydropyrimidine dehydrogenase (NAD+) subunit PreA